MQEVPVSPQSANLKRPLGMFESARVGVGRSNCESAGFNTHAATSKPREIKDLVRANIGALGEPKYLLCPKWWNQWCDYVNLESKLHEEDESAF